MARAGGEKGKKGSMKCVNQGGGVWSRYREIIVKSKTGGQEEKFRQKVLKKKGGGRLKKGVFEVGYGRTKKALL